MSLAFGHGDDDCMGGRRRVALDRDVRDDLVHIVHEVG